MRHLHGLWLALGMLAVAVPANADFDDSIAPEALRGQVLETKPDRPQGWKGSLQVGATASFNQSSSVVGAADGVTTQLGGLLDGAADYVAGQHTWSSTLKFQFAESKTPVLDNWVKAADALDIGSAYLWRFNNLDWMGPYARARMTTQVAPSYFVKPVAYTINRPQSDPSATPDTFKLEPQTRLQLTGGFDPILLNEAVGLFANPTESDAVTVKLKLGAGTQQLFTSWGYSIATDDAGASAMTLKPLARAVQAGAEFEALAHGKFTDALKWKAKAAFFFPFYSNISGLASGIDALNSEFNAGISYKLAKWLSIDYVFQAKHVPLISDKWQIQNGAVVTTGFNL